MNDNFFFVLSRFIKFYQFVPSDEFITVKLVRRHTNIQLNFRLLRFPNSDQFFGKNLNTYPLTFVLFNWNT